MEDYAKKLAAQLGIKPEEIGPPDNPWPGTLCANRVGGHTRHCQGKKRVGTPSCTKCHQAGMDDQFLTPCANAESNVEGCFGTAIFPYKYCKHCTDTLSVAARDLEWAKKINALAKAREAEAAQEKNQKQAAALKPRFPPVRVRPSRDWHPTPP